MTKGRENGMGERLKKVVRMVVVIIKKGRESQ